jgi:cell division protein FtsI (penicillin-binding protein 3)
MARILLLGLGLVGCFALIGAQLVRLAVSGGAVEHQLSLAEPAARTHARPEIVDRHGRLIATDVAVPSLYADPRLVLDRDEAVEKLKTVLPDLDERELLRQLSEEGRRFVWIKRQITPRLAQAVHDLGLPGIGLRKELKRFYPAGPLLAHVLGQVNTDNRGISGLERHIDDSAGAEPVHAPAQSRQGATRLSIDLAVAHAVREELADAMRRYQAKGAVGLVLDVTTGEIIGAASLPDYDPNRPGEARDAARLDRLAGGVFEMGSVLKLVTVAMALEHGLGSPESTWDAREPIVLGSHTIKERYGAPRILTTREAFAQSSNVAAGLMALAAGPERQRAFLERVGLIEQMRTEAGPVAPALLPPRWDKLESVTISYGHGLAVAPLQLAAVAAGLVNGGRRVQPTFLGAIRPDGLLHLTPIIRPEVSAQLRELLQLAVTHPYATGRRASIEGLAIGGKTGTADIPKAGGYARGAVIASFLAVFPIEQPRYLTLVSVFEPEPTIETLAQVTAGSNAAPTTARLVTRIAPLLELESLAASPR